jgi:spore coat polysaccharide biosynthesis protein SpsF (cytidylyltransferase family)
MLNHDAGVIIQARMGSSRLPGKSLMKIGSKPLIDHVIERCLAAAPADKVFLVTTDEYEDEILVDHVASKYGLVVFQGDKEDVRSRFEVVAQEYFLNKIVRITADDPFKDPKHIRESIQALDEDCVDYYNNFEIPTFPIGLDVESFRTKALLENIARDSSSESKEHVTLGLRKSTIFVKKFCLGEPEFTNIRLTIDTPADLEFCKRLLEINPDMENLAFDWPTTRDALMALINR